MALHIRWGAHIPEHGKHECNAGQEAQRQDPHNVQYVGDAHANRTRNASTNTGPPRSIDLVTGVARGKEAHKENHKSQSAHRSPDDDEDHLQCLDP